MEIKITAVKQFASESLMEKEEKWEKGFNLNSGQAHCQTGVSLAKNGTSFQGSDGIGLAGTFH